MTKAKNNIMYNSTIMKLCGEYVRKCQTFLQQFYSNICPYIFKFEEELAHNQFLQVATFIVAVSLLAPVILFIIFAIISATFIFVGSMTILGIVLAIGASILSCVLFCIASIFIMIGLCIHTFHQLYSTLFNSYF